MPESACRYCADAPAPAEQFYETKLFRVLVSRNDIQGHVIIVPKKHDPHFYSFDLDQLEEFGYLIKKVSFIAMRLTQAPGFSLIMSDGAQEVADKTHLEIHILPRQFGDKQFTELAELLLVAPENGTDDDVRTQVHELKNLMQLPQS